MQHKNVPPFSPQLRLKIDTLRAKSKKIILGGVHFDSPLILAPMAGVSNAPFRLLMQDLGAGGTVSEFVSSHGIIHSNRKTHHMVGIDLREKNTGLQLFGEDENVLIEACQKVQELNPKFIDLNMGCPVRKVVTKGGGSALLRNPKKIAIIFHKLRKIIRIPFSAKIRIGWDHDSINADQIVKIATEEGLDFLTIHGRTRTQQYSGTANWEYIEEIANNSSIPIIGNGDLHTPEIISNRLNITHCSALMLGRGPLKNPFIFLESLKTSSKISFTIKDYLEVIERLYFYLQESVDHSKVRLIQLKKHIVWWSAGMKDSSKFRNQIFSAKDIPSVFQLTNNFYKLAHNTVVQSISSYK